MSISDISPTQSPALSTASLYSVPPLPRLRICSSPSRTTNMLRACSPSRSSCAPGTTWTTRSLSAIRPMTRSGRPAKIGIRPRNARSTSVFSLAMASELYLCRPRKQKRVRARGRQAFAREAFGDLRVGVVGVDGQGGAGLVQRLAGPPERQQRERRGSCGRAADRCRRRPRRRSPGSCRRSAASPSAIRAVSAATPSRHPGGVARRW